MTSGSSATRRRRGPETERWVCAYLKKIFPFASTKGGSSPGRDILNTTGFSIEVKARAGFNPLAWLKQAKKNSCEHEFSVVIFRPNGMGEAQVGSFGVIMTLSDFRDLVEAIIEAQKGSEFSGECIADTQIADLTSDPSWTTTASRTALGVVQTSRSNVQCMTTLARRPVSTSISSSSAATPAEQMVLF